jgi:hypothetical protein
MPNGATRGATGDGGPGRDRSGSWTGDRSGRCAGPEVYRSGRCAGPRSGSWTGQGQDRHTSRTAPVREPDRTGPGAGPHQYRTTT